MIERFDHPLEPDENVIVERLEQGIFLEVLSREVPPVAEDETAAFVYGSFHPETNLWQTLYRQALEAGAIRGDGCITWDELARFCAEWGGSAESLLDLTLSDLTNMLDNGETVLCQLNDFVLADIRAETLPGISGNTLVWVAGVDLADVDTAAVAIGTNRGRMETVPLINFMKAWKTSRNRAMVIQAG